MKSAAERKRVLVTAGLPYSNGRIHVGHIAGAYLPSDIYVRYLKLRNVDVKYICGSDDHGVTIMLEAEKQGKTPAEVVAHFHALQKKAFDGLGINFDIYSSTSRNPYHKQVSQDFFLKMYEKGYFEKIKTRQFYDEDKNMFLPDRYVKGTCGFCNTPDQNGDQCENCGKILDVDSLKEARNTKGGGAVGVRETVHWFLDLTKFQGAVEKWLDEATLRDHTRAYVKSLISSGLVKRSMTRDIDWGIPLPIDDPEAKGKVLYVWFDAPIGYISNTLELVEGDKKKFADWWQSNDTEIVHFIGEDNTIFHCLIWIAMLAGEGSYRLPAGVVVNQFLNIQFPDKSEAEKISKSRGMAVWIEDYIAEGGNPDVLRYYLTSIAPESARTVYRPEELVQKNNTDLGNALGNFVNRILSFNEKNFSAKIPPNFPAKVGEVDKKFEADVLSYYGQVTDELEKFNFKHALFLIMELARICNKYIDDKAPWTSKKTDLELTQVTISYSIKAIQALGVMLLPFIPGAAAKQLSFLNIDASKTKWEDAVKFLPAESSLNKPEILFARLEHEK